MVCGGDPSEIERQLGETISYGSVKATLAKVAGGAHPLLERIERGRYVRVDGER